MRRHAQGRARGEVGQPADVEDLSPGEAQRLGVLARQELERQYAHLREVRAVDALVRAGDHRADAEKRGSLRGPVAAGARAVFVAGEHQERHALGPVALGGVKDRHLLSIGQVHRHAALHLRHQLVAEADVREGAAHHHLVVAAARTVGMEMLRVHAALHQPARGGGVLLDGAGGRDVVGGHRVAHRDQHARAGDVGDGLRLDADVRHEWRLGDVSRRGIPRVQVALGHRQRVPAVVALGDPRVAVAVGVGVHRAGDDLGDLLRGGPDVAQVHRLAFAVQAERLGGEVHVGAPRQRVCHHQRRRRQEREPHLRVDPPLEVPVARQHRHAAERVLIDRAGHLVGERPRVPDAGSASEAHDAEPQLVQRLQESRVRHVVHDHRRARGHRGLHGRPHGEPALYRALREQARGDHHGRVGGVSARGDRRDHHGAVGQVLLAAIHGHVDAAHLGLGLDAVRFHQHAVLKVFGGDVVSHRGHRLRVRGRAEIGQRVAEGAADAVEPHAVLGPLRTRERRLERGQVELQPLAVRRFVVAGLVEEALLLAVALDQVQERLVAPGPAQVGERLVVHREEPLGGAVLRRHVRDRRAVGDRERLEPRPEELDELADHAVRAEQFGDREDQVGGGDALLQLAAQTHADDFGCQQCDRLADERGFGLDAAYAPAQYAQAADHRGVRVGAEQRVGERDGLAVLLGGHDHAPEVFQVHLVHDAGARRHNVEPIEGPLRPAQERVALAVALVLERHVPLDRIRGAEDVHDHRVIDHQVAADPRVDAGRVPAQARHGRAHRREVGHHRYPGEVLQDHAAREERELGGLRPRPAGQRVEVRGLGTAALPAQHVLQEYAHHVGERCQARCIHSPIQPVDPDGPGGCLEAVASAHGYRLFHRGGSRQGQARGR